MQSGAGAEKGTGGYKVGYMVGSLSTQSINRTLAKALIRLATGKSEVRGDPDTGSSVVQPRLRCRLPAGGSGAQGCDRRGGCGAVRDPEYNRGIPGCLKNAIDWASRPYGTNSFAHKPSAVIGASPGKIGTAVGQQSLRSALSFCNSPLMGAPEAYIQFTPGLITELGEVTDKSTEQFLRNFMEAFEVFVTRVLTVLPPERVSATGS